MLFKREKFLWLLFAILLALTGSFGALPPTTKAGTAFAQAGGAVNENLSLKGRIVPLNWVSLSFSTGGRVSKIQVEEGQSVPAGAELARLEGSEAAAAQFAAAQLELLVASQALDELHRNAGVALAQAEFDLAEARDAQDDAAWKVRKMKEPASPLQIEQARANLQLAEEGLQKARQDFDKAQKLYDKPRDPAWMFLSRREFRQNLALLSQLVAQAERKVVDATEKYNDLLARVDEIDLAQAEAELRVANARVERATSDRDRLLAGPDAKDLELAQARLTAAEKALRGAEVALAEKRLVAPFAGTVISIPGNESQWAGPGEPVLVLADTSGWKVELEEIKENEVTGLQVRQPVIVRLDALPDLELTGQVESISWVYQEQDGEVNYSAEVSLSETHSGIRWGMTARVALQGSQDAGGSSDG